MVLAVIPARYASTRLPGKPLLRLAGESLIRRVYDRVRACPAVDAVVVATDDERIFDHVRDFGGAVVMTSADHRNGTSRVAEAARAYPEATIVINVQGDEPFVAGSDLTLLAGSFAEEHTDIATLSHPIDNERSLLSPNVVKVVTDREGRALYFSRHAIPYLRDVPVGRWIEQRKHQQHVGLYAFRAEVLQKLVRLEPDALEELESLEQLRWLRAGYAIRVERASGLAIGIDTAEDLAYAERYLADESSGSN